jgi:RNA polymerase sigma-70 factor (ECF subfamily)
MRSQRFGTFSQTGNGFRILARLDGGDFRTATWPTSSGRALRKERRTKMASATFAREMYEPADDVAAPAQIPANEKMAQFPADDNETALVAAAKAGEASAFETLVNRYERRIYRLAWNITQNDEDAEDVSQDAFLKAFQHLANFRGNSRFYTWLVRITVNQALMKLRKRRRREISLDDPLETNESLLPRELEDWGPSPEERFGQAQLGRFLAAAIAELNIGLRVVFQLRDVEELSIEQTAEILGISRAAVKSRLLRARLKLREMLQEHFRPSVDGEIRSSAISFSCA